MRKYINKSRSGLYTATVKDNDGCTVFKQREVNTVLHANYIADQYIAKQF